MNAAPLYSALRDEQSPELQAWLQNAAKRMAPEAEITRSRARMDAMFTDVSDLWDDAA